MPEFFGPLFRSAFLVNKKSLFPQKCQCIELLTVFSVTYMDCWPVWCTPCARNFPMVQPSIVYWISENLTQSNLMYPNIQYVTHSIKREIFISV